MKLSVESSGFGFMPRLFQSSHKWHWRKISVSDVTLEDIQYETALGNSVEVTELSQGLEFRKYEIT